MRVRDYRSTREYMRSFLSPDLGLWTNFVRRNLQGAQSALPLACELRASLVPVPEVR